MEEILQLIGGTTIAIALITFLGKQGIQAYINLLTQKSLSNYKNELNKMARETEHDLQRKIHDFGLYSSKRHEKYSEIYRLLQVAHSSVVKATDVVNINDYLKERDQNVLSLVSYMLKYDMAEGDIDKLAELDLDFRTKKTTAYSLVLKKYRDIAINSLRDAENYITQNELYFSSEVADLSRKFFSITNSIFREEDFDETYVDIVHQNLRRQMKREMAIGYYQET
ncbi:hypothetical protein SAMN04489762_1057 [Terribacillus saccharophilus]|uniref:Uncharacterized protein n=1 Tax=Terribacillus saccharophilus TaxID=361277 RepID=A0AAX2ED76_9BACI|nr:hypothetical protein SAMN04489762_1057 [Terribacillus saccharophilus]